MKAGWMITHGVVPPLDRPAGVELMASMAAKQVEEWNKLFPVGTPVRVYRIYQEEETAFDSKTRSAAWVMGGHSAMVKVEGQAGGHCLTHIEPLHAQGEVQGQTNLIPVAKVTYLKANDLIPERQCDFTVSGDNNAVIQRIAQDFSAQPHWDYTVAECGIQSAVASVEREMDRRVEGGGRLNQRVIKSLEWFIGQFQGDSGTGESHWEAKPEYREAKRLLDELKSDERATRYDEIRNDLKAAHDHERSCSMRVAKATNDDLDAIGILLRMLNDVSDGQFPPGVDGKHIDRDPVWLDLDDERHCMTVMKRLYELLDQNPGSLTRIYAAAHLTLTNDVFDPKEDHLTWHPDLVPAVLEREKKGRKGKLC